MNKTRASSFQMQSGGAESVRTLLAFATPPQPKTLTFMRQLGLVEPKTPKGSASVWSLTELGKRLRHLALEAPGLFPEAMHLLLYGAHLSDQTKRFSWAYAYVVRELWTRGETVLNMQSICGLILDIVHDAHLHFGVPFEKIAIGRSGIRGILNWLRELDPPVLLNSDKSLRFKRRFYCHPFSFLWAVDLLYKKEAFPTGVRMLLTPERAEELCKTCLLDPSVLEDILKLAKRASDYAKGGMFDYGFEGGRGMWIFLRAPLPVAALPD